MTTEKILTAQMVALRVRAREILRGLERYEMRQRYFRFGRGDMRLPQGAFREMKAFLVSVARGSVEEWDV